MKTAALAVLALAALSGSALSQDLTTGSQQRTTYGGGSAGYGWGGGGSSGYGPGTGYTSGYYGYYGGGWYGSRCRPGSVLGYPGFGALWGGYGYGGYYGGYYGGTYGGYGGDEGYFGRPAVAAAAAGPAALSQTAPDRTPQGTSLREMEEGRRRFRAGDYRGAVDSFRSAVVATTDSPLAQAWFAVSLIAVGDGRNADKALRAAAAGGLPSGALSLEGLFRDDKERVRMIVALAKVGGDGSLSAAYALSLAGEPARLKQLAEKDSAARLLAPKP